MLEPPRFPGRFTFGNHSFRHQLEDRLRAAQLPGQVWPAGLVLSYTGRKRSRREDVGVLAEEGSAADYGKGYRPDVMLRYIRAIDFSEVHLPPKFVDWCAEQ